MLKNIPVLTPHAPGLTLKNIKALKTDLELN